MNNKLIPVVVLVVLVLGGALLLNNKSNNNDTNPTKTANENQNPTSAKTVEGKDVTVTNKGFEPQTVTINTGQRIVWTNKSGEPVTVSSDSHPTHLKWPFLNLGKFESEGSVSVVFEKTGEYTYHNHLNASQTGTVIVE